MKRLALLALATLLVPVAALAAVSNNPVATFRSDQTLLVATSAPGNAYEAGASIVDAAPVGGDLSALGGSVTVAGPVAGDALLLGGSVSVRAPIAGDLRSIAGHIDIARPVSGDLAALGVSTTASERVTGSVFVVALDAAVTGGADGPVTIYGNSVTLGGSFASDVRIVSSGHLTLLPGTAIKGSLVYQAPVPANIPDSATVAGGITYTEASYLPGADVSRTLALASIGIFLIVRILATLILVGLLAGLFPALAEAVISEAYGRRFRHLLLTTLLGFAAFVVVPILILLLALTFIGLGLAILLFIVYALLVFLALVYSGILLGSSLARRFLGREQVLWRDGVLGTLALSIVAFIPIIGLLSILVLASFAAGALLHIFFRFAFMHADDDAVL